MKERTRLSAMAVCWCCLLILATVRVSALSDSSVHILSPYGQLVTSTTLRWVSESNGQRPESPVAATEEITLPVDEEEAKNIAMRISDDDKDLDDVKSVPVVQKPVFVCRALHNGIWVPGQLVNEENACQVSLFGEVSSYTKYEVLENIADSARLSWVKFTKFDQVPNGAVYGGEDAFIARRKVDPKDGEDPKFGRQHLVGKIRKMGFIHALTVLTEDGQEEEFPEGEVLVETEPIRYELAIQNFNNLRRKMARRRVDLGSTILKNSESSPMHVDAVLAYDEQYSLYWGQGKAILKGLPTTIRLPNGTILEQIKWGIPENEERKNVFKVEAFLEPGTAVNVSLAGNQTVSEVPYTGKLVAIYQDDATRARMMLGNRREESMRDLKATYSQAYFLGNFSLVPTTTTTSTTTTTTTTTTTSTTTTTTTTTTPPPPSTKKLEKSDRKEENMINDQASRNQQAIKEGMTSEQINSKADAPTITTFALVTSVIAFVISRIT